MMNKEQIIEEAVSSILEENRIDKDKLISESDRKDIVAFLRKSFQKGDSSWPKGVKVTVDDKNQRFIYKICDIKFSLPKEWSAGDNYTYISEFWVFDSMKGDGKISIEMGGDASYTKDGRKTNTLVKFRKSSGKKEVLAKKVIDFVSKFVKEYEEAK
jgi:hypothetical protein